MSIHEIGKARPMHRDLLLGIARGLEHVLASDVSDEEARQAWSLAEASIAADWARRYRRTLIFAIAVLVIVLSCLGGLVYVVCAKP